MVTPSCLEVTASLSNYYIGDKCANIDIDQPWIPVSQIVVKVDENTKYTAGTTTGRTMEVDCAIGSQTIADNLLAALNGFVYKGYRATDALIKPSMEIGDTVSIGGVYSIVGGMFLRGSSMLCADLSAPSSGDIDHEYPYEAFRQIVVAAKNIKHGGSYGTMHGSGITGHSISTGETSSGINQSLADADYSADVFSGAATATYGKFGHTSSGSMAFNGRSVHWEQASTVTANDYRVMCAYS